MLAYSGIRIIMDAVNRTLNNVFVERVQEYNIIVDWIGSESFMQKYPAIPSISGFRNSGNNLMEQIST